MPASIYTRSPEFPEFQFDIDDSLDKTRTYTPTKRAVEDKGNVNDHVHREPFTLASDGLVAWTPITARDWQPVPSTDPGVMQDAQNALEELAEKRQLVTLSCGIFTGQVAITSLRFSRTTADGYSTRVSIGFAEIEISKTLTTTIDPSRLRPKVRKKAGKKPGQKATGENVTGAKNPKLGEKGGKLYNLTYGKKPTL